MTIFWAQQKIIKFTRHFQHQKDPDAKKIYKLEALCVTGKRNVYLYTYFYKSLTKQLEYMDVTYAVTIIFKMSLIIYFWSFILGLNLNESILHGQSS